ncbi:MAG: phosphatase PAP2 family protein [Leptolyngbya sp.]|nr:phosphatase PAP2 family protein [Leptolyngbya sp.]
MAWAGLLGLGWAITIFPAITTWDSDLLLRLHRHATPWLDAIMPWFTDLGTVWGVLPGTLGLGLVLLRRKQQRQAIFLVGAMLGSLLLNIGIKGFWQRVRPHLWEGVPTLPDSSFPSGHATFSMAFFLAVVLMSQNHPHRRQIIGLGGGLAVLIGLSRTYLGVHYLSDVVGGWLLAFGWTVGLYRTMGFPVGRGR